MNPLHPRPLPTDLLHLPPAGGTGVTALIVEAPLLIRPPVAAPVRLLLAAAAVRAAQPAECEDTWPALGIDGSG
jgi:hypothetical protein